MRTFEPGDERHWAEIESAAGEFSDRDEALRVFHHWFGASLGVLEDRCFMLEDVDGAAIGTATAWYGHFNGAERGRVAWVGIVPHCQGQGLAKPLLGVVLERLARGHRTAYLTTQTTSYRAVNLYLDCGFVPYPTSDSCRDGWALMEHVLQRGIV